MSPNFCLSDGLGLVFNLLCRIFNNYKIFRNIRHIFMITYSGDKFTDGMIWCLAVTIISSDCVGFL